VSAGKKARRAPAPAKASKGRFATLRRWRLLPPAERRVVFTRVIARAATESEYRDLFVDLLSWLVANAPRAPHREMDLTVGQLNDLHRFLHKNLRVVEGGRMALGVSLTEALARFGALRRIDPQMLRRAFNQVPEFGPMRGYYEDVYKPLLRRSPKRRSRSV
jgi:hypothetical protein